MSKNPDKEKDSVNETSHDVEDLHEKFVVSNDEAKADEVKAEVKKVELVNIYPDHPLAKVPTRMSHGVGLFKEIEDAEINARVAGNHGVSATLHNLRVCLADLKHVVYECEKNSNAEVQSIIKHIKSVLLKETS